MSYVLGVDAGNTKTIALVAQLDGQIVGAGRSGCGDIYGAGSPTAAFAAIDTAVGAALEAAGLRADQIAAGGFSMAGADWPEDYELLRSELGRRGYGRRYLVVNDALGGLRAGSPDGTGVAVVCGTGIATGARSCDGRMWHTSFWQEANGAEYLGREVLRAACRAELGIDPPTSLTRRVVALYEQPDLEAVIHLITARDTVKPAKIHMLARVLLDEAQAGDATAREIVARNGATLGDYALAAARKVGLETAPFTLVLAGGVLRHPCPLLRDALVARVRERSPQAVPVLSRFEPAIGALLLAFDTLDLPADSGVLARIAATMPALTLFAT